MWNDAGETGRRDLGAQMAAGINLIFGLPEPARLGTRDETLRVYGCRWCPNAQVLVVLVPLELKGVAEQIGALLGADGAVIEMATAPGGFDFELRAYTRSDGGDSGGP